jgi:hypothetical protein
MEKIIKCVDCRGNIRIACPSEPSDDIPDVTLDVACPLCGEPNTVLWPENTPYTVTPAD